MNESFVNRIFSLSDNDVDFNDLCLEIFDFQLQRNPLYKNWASRMNRPFPVHYTEIPFLPISFFKSHRIITDDAKAELVFTSSTTSGNRPSTHFVRSARMYEESFLRGFHKVYGQPDQYIILGLLPGYLDRTGSSLIHMVGALIRLSGDSRSGFFSSPKDLSEPLRRADASGKKVLLIGVSFALLDLIETVRIQLKNTIIMETGGMKGRRQELTREALHQAIKSATGLASVHSEYGMTELLSQAYSLADGIFNCPHWMRVLIRQTSDPLCWENRGKSGGANIIDLANVYSCPFIATDDLGRAHEGNRFEILGRFDHSEVRGCNLMAG